jgi:hypothetical protein
MPTLPRARLVSAALLVLLGLALAGCQFLPGIEGQPEVRCGRFDGPDCNDLLELGLDAVSGTRLDVPLVIAVGAACPDNARCVPSALGGETVAVVVRWPDGTMDWATIPLAADWPASSPGPAEAQDGPVPDHLQALVGVGG